MTGWSPPLRWCGGKRRMAPLLSQLLAMQDMRPGDCYYEPFCGGAALFFFACPSRAVLNDKNDHLILAFQELASATDAVIGAFARYVSAHSATAYASAVDDLYSDLPRPMKAAAFLYVNSAAFNGLWRVNAAGRFNVPMGRRPRYRPDALRRAGEALRCASLLNGDYAAALIGCRSGDRVFLDPPYDAAYTGYAAPFRDSDQISLSFEARRLAELGAHVVVTNHDTPFIRDLYPDFHSITRPARHLFQGHRPHAELILRRWPC